MSADRFQNTDCLSVTYHGEKVGSLALTQNRKVAFAYERSWIENGFSISPFSLPLTDQVYISDITCFHGLYGVFADALPDAWGQLLLQRLIRKHRFATELSVLDRLAIVGRTGMGALEYEPEIQFAENGYQDDLDKLSEECRNLLISDTTDNIDRLYHMAGSSGGARPKVLIRHDDREYLIKFPAHTDNPEIGQMEYRYNQCAAHCGIDIPDVKLFPSEKCGGYFGSERFDRNYESSPAEKIHVLTAAALLEVDYASPCLDYHTLMKLTRILTRENRHDIENMFRRACFNVFAHNRDDHAKNFTFKYVPDIHGWRLAPAYDLTYSNTYFGEHTTSVDGNGKNPGETELMKVGLQAGIRKAACSEIIECVRETVNTELKDMIK